MGDIMQEIDKLGLRICHCSLNIFFVLLWIKYWNVNNKNWYNLFLVQKYCFALFAVFNIKLIEGVQWMKQISVFCVCCLITWGGSLILDVDLLRDTVDQYHKSGYCQAGFSVAMAAVSLARTLHCKIICQFVHNSLKEHNHQFSKNTIITFEISPNIC